MLSQLSSQLILCLHYVINLSPILQLPQLARIPLMVNLYDLGVNLRWEMRLVLSFEMGSIFDGLLNFILSCLEQIAIHHKIRTYLSIMRQVGRTDEFDGLSFTAKGLVKVDRGFSLSKIRAQLFHLNVMMGRSANRPCFTYELSVSNRIVALAHRSASCYRGSIATSFDHLGMLYGQQFFSAAFLTRISSIYSSANAVIKLLEGRSKLYFFILVFWLIGRHRQLIKLIGLNQFRIIIEQYAKH